MSAHAIGHVHRPVQTLVDTFISFSRLPQAKKKCKQIPPSAPHPKHRLIQCVNSVFRFFYALKALQRNASSFLPLQYVLWIEKREGLNPLNRWEGVLVSRGK